MLIRGFGREDINEVSGQKAMGIYGVKRIIYVFLTKDQYNLRNFTNCKACIVNQVVYDSKHDLSHPLTIDGGVLIKNAVYFGNIVCQVPGNLKGHDSFFLIDSVTSNEKMRMPNNEEMVSFSSSTWSKRLYQMEPADLSDYIGISGSDMGSAEVLNLSPEYYTPYEMNRKTGDFIDLLYEPTNKVSMDKLIDANTSIVYMDLAKYDTMRLDVFRQLPKVDSICKESFDYSNLLKSAFSSYVGQGTTFVYDSDAKGMGKSGIMVRGGSIPFGKVYHQKYLINNLDGAVQQFDMSCKDMEHYLGHIRVLYNPSDVGDKVKIRFKDYKKSPIIAPRQVNNDGSVNINLSNVSPLSSIDNGYVTDEYMKDILATQYENTQDYFQREMFMR